MTNKGQLFFRSALVLDGPVANSKSIMPWFWERQKAHSFEINQIPFLQMKKWIFDNVSGNLHHESGKFFSIEGIRVKTNWGIVPEWDQPIINQPEIGFLGFITKQIKGVLHFLVQAKMEPGNINMIQLAPTLQATRSNFTRVHNGKRPPYLEYFTDRARSRVLVDALQSEQGARFLRKRNRNIIIQIDHDIPVYDDYCWMTLRQLLHAMRHNNIVNMDARTVISCITYDCATGLSSCESRFARSLCRSLDVQNPSLYSNEEIISWFTEQKFKYDLYVDRIPLINVMNWERTKTEIRHESGSYFNVIACSVEADNREVSSWTQPLIKTQQEGLIAFVVKEFNGILHFLVQAKVEPGNFDVIEMAPTVQCITGSYMRVPVDGRPPFVNYVLQAEPHQIHYDTLQSEEGGRFFQEENRNLIVYAQDDFPKDIPDNYIWMTAYQIKEFIKYNNFVNVQARCLLASLSFA